MKRRPQPQSTHPPQASKAPRKAGKFQATKKQDKAKNGARPPWASFPQSLRDEIEGPMTNYFAGKGPSKYAAAYRQDELAAPGIRQLVQAIWTALAAIDANHKAIQAKKAQMNT